MMCSDGATSRRMSGTCRLRRAAAGSSQSAACDHPAGGRHRQRRDRRDRLRLARGPVAAARPARPAVQLHPGRLRARAVADRNRKRKWLRRRAAGLLRVRRVQGNRKEFHAVRQRNRRTRLGRLCLDHRQSDGVGHQQNRNRQPAFQKLPPEIQRYTPRCKLRI